MRLPSFGPKKGWNIDLSQREITGQMFVVADMVPLAHLLYAGQEVLDHLDRVGAALLPLPINAPVDRHRGKGGSHEGPITALVPQAKGAPFWIERLIWF
jgi:hypothetical protein